MVDGDTLPLEGSLSVAVWESQDKRTNRRYYHERRRLFMHDRGQFQIIDVQVFPKERAYRLNLERELRKE
jgi:hypothetical protein